jgi:hypothetical protein
LLPVPPPSFPPFLLPPLSLSLSLSLPPSLSPPPAAYTIHTRIASSYTHRFFLHASLHIRLDVESTTYTFLSLIVFTMLFLFVIEKLRHATHHHAHYKVR